MTISNTAQDPPLKVRLWAGVQTCLIAMDVDPKPGSDFVGFAIEVKSPGAPGFTALRNRLAFEYPAGAALTGSRDYPTTEAPLQTFRWIHFPREPKVGDYAYRVTMKHMTDGVLRDGASATARIALCGETIPGFLDIAFTRNIASSQAFVETFPDLEKRTHILPTTAKLGLTHDKSLAPAGVYEWLGGKATALLFSTLHDVQADPELTLDVLAYDLNEPDLVKTLEAIASAPARAAGAPNLRIVIDDSGEHHAAGSSESQSAVRLKTAGATVVRHHFDGLQHNKVVIVRRKGVPERVLCGSTNFSFRGLYIQANNMLAFKSPDVAALFAAMFELALKGPNVLENDPLSKVWHTVSGPDASVVRVCFSPHPDASELSLTPVAGAVEQAASSVFYSSAFLNQDTRGPVRKAIDRLVGKPLFSYGVVNNDTGLALQKPDGSQGVVDFAYLHDHAPVPFAAEWSGQQGINIHHKFVVTDFNLPTGKVFAGSSNLSMSGEEKNGDQLIQISDQRVATVYTIEALRMFDHLHFRTNMAAADAQAVPKVLTLAKPPGPGQTAWFERFYVEGSQKARDRLLFSTKG